MRIVFPLLCVVLLAVPCISPAQEQFSIYGFSYYTPPLGIGTVTTLVAALEPPNGFTYPLTLDFGANEYTFYCQGAVQSVVGGAITIEYHFSDVTFAIYEDPSKNKDYGVNPPNATSPSTFQDGTAILTGTLSNLIRVDYTMGFPEPSLMGDCTFTGGTRLGDLVQGNNWNFHGGLSTNPVFGIPTGYRDRWATKIVFTGPLPVESSTWGSIKALYESD
jgi:hypothetical protein